MIKNFIYIAIVGVVLLIGTYIFTPVEEFVTLIEKCGLMNNRIIIIEDSTYFDGWLYFDTVNSPVIFHKCVTFDTIILSGDTLTNLSNIQ